MEWSKAQELAIVTRNKNILVSAAAGSGKTAVLVERIKRLIIEEKTEIDQILVVTFSNAAAAELKERIISSIYKEIDKSQGNEDFLIRQLNKIGRANISTFHAFSLEIIRRYFYLIKLEPNFRICDDANRIILQNVAMEELFDKRFKAIDEEFLLFLNKYATSKNENEAKDMISSAYSFIQSMPYPLNWLNDSIEMLKMDEVTFINSKIYAEIRRDISINFAKAVENLAAAIAVLNENGVYDLAKKFEAELTLIESKVEQILNDQIIDFKRAGELLKSITFERAAATKAEKPDFDLIKDEIKSLRDLGKDLIRKDVGLKYFQKSLQEHLELINKNYEVGKTFLGLVTEFDSIYSLKKAEKNLIDFSDIEHMALSILEDEKVASEYKEKFKHIFIDEYQDSNLVQETLIDRVKRENNLFMVGDVKQSIYKFRLAEPGIFLEKYKKFKEEKSEVNLKIDLNQNFRSKGKIIDSINFIFRKIMKEESAEINYDDDAALYKGSPYIGELDYCVEMLAVNSSIGDDDQSIDDEIKEMRTAEIEARAVAIAIKELIGKSYFDDKLGSVRELKLSDIVILMRSAAGYKDVYSQILSKEEIPNYLDMEDGYFDTIEISVFLNLLRLIDNKMQDIPLLSVLRSPIFDFTLKELINIRIKSKSTSYYEAFSSYAAYAELDEKTSCNDEENKLSYKCKSVLKKLEEWKFASTYLTIDELILKLINETIYYNYLGALPNGFQRQANINALIDKAILFQSFHLKGLFGFINYIDQLRKDKVITGQVKLLSENDNVVRIMTVHKSKGLEFPAVIVSALGKRFNKDNKSSKVNFHKDFGVGLRYVDLEQANYSKTLNQIVIEDKKEKEAMAEEMRILYVALTRAKEKLILVGTLKDYDETVISLKNIEDRHVTSLSSFFKWLIVAQKGSSIPQKIFKRNQVALPSALTIAKSEALDKIFSQGFEVETNCKLENQIDHILSFKYTRKTGTLLQSKFSVSEIKRISNNEKFLLENSPRISDSQDQTLFNIASSTLSIESSGVNIESAAFKQPKFLRELNEMTAAEKGTILHYVMEKIDYKIGANAKKVKDFIESLVLEGYISKEESEAINSDKIVKFFESNLGIRASSSQEIKREASFVLQKSAKDLGIPGALASDEKIIIQGTIDSFFKDSETAEYILIDFKTDYLKSDDQEAIDKIVGEYKIQLQIYKEAIEKIKRVKVREVYLYLFYIDKAILIEF